MLVIRPPDSIYQAHGTIHNGTFQGRWHFSFDQYDDPEYTRFGALRVFNDDTLSPGAVWPLHPHRGIEVITYCAAGEFRHADESGKGGILRPGWIQHTTVGRGMWHSEINNRADAPMRFIQMWFLPMNPNLEPAVQQKRVTRKERTGRFLPLASSTHPRALPLFAEAQVHAAFLPAGAATAYAFRPRHGGYLYVVEGGPVTAGGHPLAALAAARITAEKEILVNAGNDAELLLVDVLAD
jgi:redox-sensitive bicupin YhaK (pirin superfamily)